MIGLVGFILIVFISWAFSESRKEISWSFCLAKINIIGQANGLNYVGGILSRKSIALWTLCFVLLPQLFVSIAYSETRIWIDSDLSIGEPGKDVDDGYALIQAMRSPEISIVGVSLVHGNIANISKQYQIAMDIIRRFSPMTFRVWKGAGSPKQFGTATEASDALSSALSRERLRILALGPLTNIATAIRLNPSLRPQIEELVVMAGRKPNSPVRLGPHNVILPDTNIDNDVESVRFILEQKIPITMIPTEAMRESLINDTILANLRTGHFAGPWLFQKSKTWIRLWKLFTGLDGFIPFDTLLVGYISHPQFFSCSDNIRTKLVKRSDDTFPRVPFRTKLFLEAQFNSTQSTGTDRYCERVDRTFIDVLVSRLK
ncbi:MAG: hypothetical protein COT74_00660 [Bdellovibrionales bacterium CG10_big_fil_rev_8_21_14_0_10_45_34]|nr:MAG: hypothetical protein COT74_00660 [Bdellovibrionales bacterium CG10_big_fil_rev_8_21_14_0_10_45_34]